MSGTVKYISKKYCSGSGASPSINYREALYTTEMLRDSAVDGFAWLSNCCWSRNINININAWIHDDQTRDVYRDACICVWNTHVSYYTIWPVAACSVIALIYLYLETVHIARRSRSRRYLMNVIRVYRRGLNPQPVPKTSGLRQIVTARGASYFLQVSIVPCVFRRKYDSMSLLKHVIT